MRDVVSRDAASLEASRKVSREASRLACVWGGVVSREAPCEASRVAWGLAWRGVAWRGVAWLGVAWRGVRRRVVSHAAPPTISSPPPLPPPRPPPLPSLPLYPPSQLMALGGRARTVAVTNMNENSSRR